MSVKSLITSDENKTSDVTSKSSCAVSIFKEVKTPIFEGVAGLLALDASVYIRRRT